MTEQKISNVDIVWPEPAQIIPLRQRNPTLQYIQKLCNGLGITSCIILLLLTKVLRPLLEENYEQRRFLAASVLLKVRKLVATLQRRFSHTAVTALGFEERGNYISRATQTSEFGGVGTEEDMDAMSLYATNWPHVLQRLRDLKTNLDDFNSISAGGSTSAAVDELMEHTKEAIRSVERNYNNNMVESRSDEIIGIIRQMKAKCITGSLR